MLKTVLLVVYLFLPNGEAVKDQVVLDTTVEHCLTNDGPEKREKMKLDHPDATSAIFMCILQERAQTN